LNREEPGENEANERRKRKKEEYYENIEEYLLSESLDEQVMIPDRPTVH